MLEENSLSPSLALLCRSPAGQSADPTSESVGDLSVDAPLLLQALARSQETPDAVGGDEEKKSLPVGCPLFQLHTENKLPGDVGGTAGSQQGGSVPVPAIEEEPENGADTVPEILD